MRYTTTGINRPIREIAYETLKHAIITDRKRIPPATRRRLALLIGKYL
jgi:hypothetical protein